MVARSLLVVGLVCIAIVCSSCRARGEQPAPVSVTQVPPPPPLTAERPPPPAPIPVKPAPLIGPARPSLATEPRIGVLLASEAHVEFTLGRPARAEADGHAVALPAGTVAADFVGGTVRIGGIGGLSGRDVRLVVEGSEGQPTFSATLHPPFGKVQTLRFAGQPRLHADAASKEVELIEEIGLETYLAGVVSAEMNPGWPLAALKAQAIAARSYASARYLERAAQAWQLHWHYSVDMAYAGASAKRTPALAAALAQTRGQVMTFHGQPVLALFHASSGGRSEAMRNLWPDLRGPDGTTHIDAAMPVVDDPFAEGGAAGLGLTATHWRWKAEVTFAQLSVGLQAWSQEKPRERPRFGAVTGVRLVDRFADSGRVAHVAIRHRLGKKEVETVLPANEFRMAANPGVVRSTWWDRCVAVADQGGALVLEGRGFGHGVGLSQVSAWQMARQGQPAERILALFYPGAGVSGMW